MKTSFLLSSLLITSFLFGCSSLPYKQKQLNDNAKGIATTKTTPYGCKALGSVEGKDEAPPNPPMTIVTGNSLLSVREGAINDLRNNAADVVGNSKKRVILKFTSAKAMCFGGITCPNQNDPQQSISGYYITADVFECGDK